jgi:hypothetical protein
MDPVSSADQIRKSVAMAIMEWRFLPVLASIVLYGDVVLTFHDGQLREVSVPIGGIRRVLVSKPPGEAERLPAQRAAHHIGLSE